MNSFVGEEFCERIDSTTLRVTVDKAIISFIDVDYTQTYLELHKGDVWSCSEEDQINGLFLTLEEAKYQEECFKKWAKRWEY